MRASPSRSPICSARSTIWSCRRERAYPPWRLPPSRSMNGALRSRASSTTSSSPLTNRRWRSRRSRGTGSALSWICPQRHLECWRLPLHQRQSSRQQRHSSVLRRRRSYRLKQRRSSVLHSWRSTARLLRWSSDPHWALLNHRPMGTASQRITGRVDTGSFRP